MRFQLRFDSDGRCVNSYEVLSDPQHLIEAYESIKSKSGNMVRGSDRETLDGISKD